MIEQEVAFTSSGLRLSGTLVVPQGPDHPACVLLVPGSGQVDRNENHKRLPINVFGDLARRFSEHGIGSLRYDKRGVGASEGGFWETGFYENVADASAALSFLKQHETFKTASIYLLGHSEGAYIVARVAAATPDVAGVILLAGGARLGEEELKWQAAQVARSLTGVNRWLVKTLRIDVAKAQQKQIDMIRRSGRDWYRTQLVAKVNAKWMREFLAYDPAEDLAKIKGPILAITGEKDIQVDPANLTAMAALVTAPFESHVVPDVTHILRSEPGAPSLSTYKQQARRPVEPRVITLILDWLERQDP